ncbi:hypothetical protein ALC57_05666 [Trachymyrmex cornetzi]|uniref:Helix-turn-helix domain-containing protein n=1 Tax=Trachymyrmex cornetzi TaxID=471704 RepID=A0A151JAJ8_9HYME|nr:hypothetical protein ALC57_05666 [Trachymyrmex cornetzi]
MLERRWTKLSIPPSLYVRYVDDILLIIKSFDYKEILDTFNSYHPGLKFTMEEGGDSINCHSNKGRISSTLPWYIYQTIAKNRLILLMIGTKKPTFSGRFLNFYSCHPLSQKVGTIMSLIDRIILLFYPKFHLKNFDFIIDVLLRNGYPLKLIFKTIKKILYTARLYTTNHSDQTYRNHINRNPTQSSVIIEHRLQTSHDFNWDNIKILDKEKFWNKRMLSEMIHIKKQKYRLNLQNDTYKLDPLYESLFSTS